MRIGTPKEIFLGENRVAMTPESAIQLQKLGYECFIQKGAGDAARFSDKDYKDNDRSDALQLLVDFTSSFAEDMGYKYSFAWATPGVLLDKYIESGFSVNNTPSHELIIKY